MTQLTKERLAVALGLAIITLSNVEGHFHPPFSIQWTPIFLVLIIAGINHPLYKSDFKLTATYNFALLLFNDIFVRVYAGGTHDDEGRDWISLFFSGTFILSAIAMLIYAAASGKDADAGSRNKMRKQNALTVAVSAVATVLIYCTFVSKI